MEQGGAFTPFVKQLLLDLLFEASEADDDELFELLSEPEPHAVRTDAPKAKQRTAIIILPFIFPPIVKTH